MVVLQHSTVGTLPVPPTRSGFEFQGWNTEPDGSGSVFDETTPVSCSLTVYAQWSACLTVTFRGNGGSPTQTVVSALMDKTVTPWPADPTRTYYKFVEWNTKADGTGEPFTASTLVRAERVTNNNLDVYAQWQRTHYTVTFHGNGGSPNQTMVPVLIGEVVTPWPANPTRANHQFAGWNTRQDGSGPPFLPTTPVTAAMVDSNGNLTVYAQWVRTEYTVTFRGNGGSPNQTVVSVLIGGVVTPWPADPTRANHQFTGWNTKDDGSGSPFTQTTPVTAAMVDGNGNLTVYAQWQRTEYTVTFHGNGGSPNQTVVSVPIGSCITTLPANPTRANHQFAGWNTKDDGTGNFITPPICVTAAMVDSNGNFTVYARWERTEYTVAFHGNQGNPTRQNATAPVGEVVTPWPANPTRTYYKFVEWNTKQDGTGSPFTQTTPVTAAMVNSNGHLDVYAKWERTHYTVAFHGNGGSPPRQDASVLIGGCNITPWPASPTLAHHRFTGWNTKADGTGSSITSTTCVTSNMVTNNHLDVYAKWERSHYTVTFHGNGGSPTQQSAVALIGGVAVPWPSDPTRGKDYKFIEWNTKDDGEGSPFTQTTLVTSGMVTNNHLDVYAKWEPIITIFSIIRSVGAVALTPIENEDSSERLATVEVEVSGFVEDADAELVELDMEVPQGLSWTETSLVEEGVKTFRLSVAYDGETAFPEASASLQLKGLHNIPGGYRYEREEEAQSVSLPIIDGQAPHRPIPVHPGNREAFEHYKKTPEGRKRHYQETAAGAALP